MIYGVGVDISEVHRFEKWIKNPELLCRFFNEKEIISDKDKTLQFLCEHYAARFAAKEAFGKALGTGIGCFTLSEIFVQNNKTGKPELFLEGNAFNIFSEICPEGKIHISLSHEKQNAVAFCVIEKE